MTIVDLGCFAACSIQAMGMKPYPILYSFWNDFKTRHERKTFETNQPIRILHVKVLFLKPFSPKRTALSTAFLPRIFAAWIGVQRAVPRVDSEIGSAVGDHRGRS